MEPPGPDSTDICEGAEISLVRCWCGVDFAPPRRFGPPKSGTEADDVGGDRNPMATW